jgi:mono/diheme cytochrome c family protein
MPKAWLALIVAAVVVAAAAVAAMAWIRRGFSARDQPSAVETLIARRMRSMSIPAGAKQKANPVQLTPEVLEDARGHFADHCATCHANDGSGDTDIGRNLYPKAPDMRLDETQKLSDGELFYIIHNGVRLTGMPAWGTADEASDEDSWKLVHFVRHLPALTPEEIEEMEALNPKSPADLEEEKADREFLGGAETEPPKKDHQHRRN